MPAATVAGMDARFLLWKDLPAADRASLFSRSSRDIEEAIPRVRPILESVRTRGDAALVEASRTFDGADIAALPLRVSDEEIDAAERGLDRRVKDAIRACADNVRRCHQGRQARQISPTAVRPSASAREKSANRGFATYRIPLRYLCDPRYPTLSRATLSSR